MCGISGVYDPYGGIERALLRNMAATMRHRGPDHTGFWVSPDGRAGLAHNRLSIIDLSEAGNQPMAGSDASRQIVFNGEIYNFPQLRTELESNGCRLRSHCDTEVIVRLYEEKGAGLLGDLSGMFAFCIYDAQRGTLFLARDRAGIKPLYYAAKNGRFAFASEPKALLGIPFVSRELDPAALDAYFTLGYIPGDLCIFKDIRKLEPAHYSLFDTKSGELTLHRYWDARNRALDLSGATESDLTDMLEKKLRGAVRSHMISDVPIGCFLSGGLDSTLVAALMAQESPVPVNTFTIRFSSAQHDESPYARIVAEHIGSRHTEHCVEMDASASLHRLVENFDEPFADSSMIPTYYVSKAARERVTVALSGDGGDELFGGYNWYSWMYRLREIETRLGPLAGLAPALAPFWPAALKGKRFAASLGLAPERQFLARLACFPSGDKASLYSPEFRDSLRGCDFADVFMKRFRDERGDLLRRMTLTDFHCYLPEDILTKVDRASMAVSLETRVPWLDPEVVEFAFSLPSEFKIRKGRKKLLSKLLAKKLAPPSLPLERKQGFSIPLQQWMRGGLGAMLESELNAGGLSCYIDPGEVRRRLMRHRSDSRSVEGVPLFAVLVFSIWRRNYIEGLT